MRLATGLAAVGAVLAAMASDARTFCPYGVVTDATRSEYGMRDEIFRLAEFGGMKYVRVDWDMRVVKPRKDGPYDFSRYDRFVDEAERRGLTVLPILYGTPDWASPVWEHLDAYEDFCRATVARYAGRMPAVEVWNEPNIPGFWYRQPPNATNYVAALRAAYRGVKAADPSVRVVFGGMAGWAHGYVEDCYKAGMKDFFDVMCVHPYTYPFPAETSHARDLKALREIMARYGDGQKPVWYTEIGWPTHDVDISGAGNLVEAGLRVALAGKKAWNVIYAASVLDGQKEDPDVTATLLERMPVGSQVRMCGPKETVKLLGEGGWDAVIYPPDESFPVDTLPAVEKFVREGGTLVDLGGMPIWNPYRNLPEGGSTRGNGPYDWNVFTRLHIGCDSWWIGKSELPKNDRLTVYATPDGVAAGVKMEPTGLPCGHFFTDRLLKPGDRWVPLVKGTNPNNGKDAVAACVYLFDSDLKGRCVISGISAGRGTPFKVNEAMQAKYYMRALAFSLAQGVEAFFYYSLRARERDRFYSEDNFGVVHANLAPKPAFLAHRFFTRMRPEGSANLPGNWQEGTLYWPQWKRPDGTCCGMVWDASEKDGPRPLWFSGDVRFFDLYGKPIPVRKLEDGSRPVPVSGTPVYFEGATVAVKPAVPRSCVPGGYGGEKWKSYRERFEAELATAKAGGAPVVFLGDSITHNWEEPGRGKEVWERHFAAGRFRAVNFGIKGDSTCNLIYRLQRGVLDGFKAKAVVLQIGTNNLKNDSPEDIRLGVKACLDLIRAKQPDATVVLHPVPMCAPTPDAPMRRQTVAANAELAKLADGERVVWCEWSQRMLLPDGTIPKSMIPDTCHPLRPGYELWAEALLPVLGKIVPEEGPLVIRGGGGALSVDPVYGDILPGSDGVFRSGDLGLWSVKFKSGVRLSASEFRRHPEWCVERTGNRFVFREGHADVTVEFVGGPDGVDVRGTVVAKKDDPVLSFELPARLWFDPAKVGRFYMPQRGNGGMGFALKRSFFEETSKLRYPSWRQVGPHPWKRNPPEERAARVAAELKSAVRASDRPKVGFVRCVCGPEWGSGDSVLGYRRKLDGELRAARAEVEVVDIGGYAELVAALKDDRFRLVFNPYGDLVPMRGAGDIAPTVAAVRDYVARGGRWVSAVDVAEITAFVPGGYLSYAAPYPNLFMDFCHLRTVDGGDVSVYGVRPRPAHKAWENPPAFHFVPGSLACGGAARGGYVDHAFAVYGEKGRPFAVPAVRFAFGRRLQEAVDDYARANDLTRPLADKIPAERLATLKRAALVTMYGSRANRCAEVADRLSPPALLHISSYLKGGFDKEYPDHLPSNAERFGTDAEHRAFIDRLRARGHLYMPYTNPTWWCDHPRGPTFQAAGEAPLLIGADGRHNHEVYKQDGWTTCFWHPSVIAANRRTVSQFLTDLPVDILFQDQCGARRCPYDFNPAAPTPVAYSEGLLSQVEEDAARVPLGTEDGWDRVANEEVCLCGVSWQTIPRHLDFRKSDYRPLQKELASPETWEIEPLAARLMHEKCLFYCHDLSGSAYCPRLVAWDLAMGYNLSVDASPGEYLRKADVRTWCDYVLALQRHVASRIAGRPLREWRHDRAPLLARTDIAATDRRDDGVVTARWGEVRCVVNLGDVPRTVGDVCLAPYGYVVEGPGFRADYLEGRCPRLTGEGASE